MNMKSCKNSGEKGYEKLIIMSEINYQCDANASENYLLGFQDSMPVWNSKCGQHNHSGYQDKQVPVENGSFYSDGVSETSEICNMQLGLEFQTSSLVKKQNDVQFEDVNCCVGAGLSEMFFEDESLGTNNSLCGGASESGLTMSCQISSTNAFLDGLFEGESLGKRDYEKLEDRWSNIDKLNNLEDMDSLFLEPVIQNNPSDLDEDLDSHGLFLESHSSSKTMFHTEVPTNVSYSELFSGFPQPQYQNSLDCMDIQETDNLVNECIKTSQNGLLEQNKTTILASPFQKQDKPTDVKCEFRERIATHNEKDNDQGDMAESKSSSIEVSALHELQQTMKQLDFKTRISIRDALYRLARNSTERHSAGPSNHRDGIQQSETCTNLIDRTIMNMLFWKEGSPVFNTLPSNSLKSRAHCKVEEKFENCQ